MTDGIQVAWYECVQGIHSSESKSLLNLHVFWAVTPYSSVLIY